MASLKPVSVCDVNETADGVRTLVNVTDETMQIDESLYSRQLYVMGHEAQMRMSNARVLIIGLNGLGVEIAKNVILAGVKNVTLYDKTPTSYLDLAAQFYLTENDLNTPRASACVTKLAELNPYVQVEEYSGELVESFLTAFRVVVLVNSSQSEAQRINRVCHEHDVAFISTEARGVFGSVFCDFGKAFTIYDKDGNQPITSMISSISYTSPPLVTVSDDAGHGLESDDYVMFRELRGDLAFLNDGTPRKVKVMGPYTFTLEFEDDADKQLMEKANQDDSVGGESGGYVTSVKMPVTMKFKALEEALVNPGEFLISDFAKMESPSLLHFAFQALDVFQTKHDGRYPSPGNFSEAYEVFAHVLQMNKDAKDRGQFYLESLDEEKNLKEAKKNVFALASGSVCVIAPMSAFLGGVVGQETLKGCSGKFTPIHQFFYFEAIECLPSELLDAFAAFDANKPLNSDVWIQELKPCNTRYDAQIAVFGSTLQRNIQDLSMFLVGAGAIGCEMLKNWALMGVSTGPNAVTHLTDMDTIEKSNLNRQFLFRSKDVQNPKSEVAARAIQEMNPNIHVKAYLSRVGAETETQFNDDFFLSLFGVCTALDNVEARLYMDQRCLFYGLPMFESGTLGTKGNTQIVVPHLTENYGASRDPPEKSIPICTLKNFPNAIEHTLQWARDWFEGEFLQAPSDVNQYLTGAEFLKQLNAQQNTKVETLERLKKSLVDHRPLTFDACILWARLKFEDMFCNQIKQLLYNFPLDQVTTTGSPFWSGPKRPPTPVVFDPQDPLHLDFVVSVANSRAINYGLKGHFDLKCFKETLGLVQVPEFTPRAGVKIASNDAEAKEANDSSSMMDIDLSDLDAHANSILKALPSLSSLAGYRMQPIEFDKDNDSHMQVIVACSNLRARCYRIPEADMHKSRFIAGKIIPAIATTTALVTGLVCLELYKVIQKKSLGNYKNSFVNLSLPLITFYEPIEPKKTKTKLKGRDYIWTPWDRLDIPVEQATTLTLQGFLDFFQNEHQAEVSMLSIGVTILYAMYSQKSRSQERLSMKMKDLVELVTKKSIPEHQKFLILEMCANHEDGEDLELPVIRFSLRE